MDIEMVCLHCLKTEPHVHPPNDQGVVLIDLDSSLCDISGRLHLAPPEEDRAKPEAWHKFHLALATDRINPGVAELAKAFHHLGPLHLISSGRPKTYWKQTMVWLNRHDVKYDAIVLRSPEDHDLKTFKARYVIALTKNDISVRVAVDDDPEVIDSYERISVPTLQVSTTAQRLELTNAVAG